MSAVTVGTSRIVRSMAREGTIRWRDIGRDRAAELVAAGHRERGVFAHRLLFLPRPAPDGWKVAERTCGAPKPSAFFQVLLYAAESELDGIPAELFFDRDIAWHEQHLGRVGQLASANVVVDGKDMWSFTHFADVVQRVGRRRDLKTQVEKRFDGWHDLLLNGLLAFAVQRGVKRWRIPASALALRHTDQARDVRPELFERLYDRSVGRILDARRDGEWWRVDVKRAKRRLVVPELREEHVVYPRTVCVAHDLEAGLGHRGIDDALAAQADARWRDDLAGMLQAEAGAGVRATYNVVGVLVPEVREAIEAPGHALAFHSYDHDLARPEQLAPCRDVDYRAKGYRVPQSRLTADLADDNLLRHNVEWLASSAWSLGFDAPQLVRGVVRVPVHLDDFGLYKGELAWEDWEAKALAIVAERDVSVLSLHDCYAPWWLERYPAFLARLRGEATLRTVDELAAEIVLCASL
jgi:hypothetical protein